MALSDNEFAAIWKQHGSPKHVAEAAGISIRGVYLRRKAMAKKGIILPTIPAAGYENRVSDEWNPRYAPAYERERRITIADGYVVVGSDAHIWPSEYTPAMNGFLAVIKALKPKAVFANGDWLDGARVSRHARIGWAQAPALKDEVEAVQDFAADVEKVACPKKTGCEFYWNMGNHDLRYDNMLSARAEDIEGFAGSRLSDHFPRWQFQWSVMINDDVMIKHRGPSGSIHAAYNNALKGGLSIATGHTHHLEVKPWGDYRGRRYGVQTGCLADPHSSSFEYTENNPTTACAGFAVLSFRDGRLLMPELAEVIGGKCFFRGEVIA